MRCPMPPRRCSHLPCAMPTGSSHSSGFTLAELLVASTIALGVVGAVATLFGIFSRTASTSQSIVEMTTRMRTAANMLRSDLAGVTAPLSPPLSPADDAGYFELIEGTGRVDSTAASPAVNPAATIEADTDDALLFTTRSLTTPYRGLFSEDRNNNGILDGGEDANGNGVLDVRSAESSTAEVAWFCRPAVMQTVSGLRLHTLYRRQLLVLGYPGAPPFLGGAATNTLTGTSARDYYSSYDVSMRPDDFLVNTLVPNTLGDLTRRENRFFHGPTFTTAFPSGTTAPPGLIFSAASGRQGEDIVLTNVIAFDIRVFDPLATQRSNGAVSLYPGDDLYNTAPLLMSGGNALTGCWVDLGQNAAAGTLLCSAAAPKSGVTATYDTWSSHLEHNGINDDAIPAVDQGSNGIDDSTPADGVPDDPSEQEVPPPYATHLKAIEIRIRCYDPTSKEIRQFTVRHSLND